MHRNYQKTICILQRTVYTRLYRNIASKRKTCSYEKIDLWNCLLLEFSRTTLEKKRRLRGIFGAGFARFVSVLRLCTEVKKGKCFCASKFWALNFSVFRIIEKKSAVKMNEFEYLNYEATLFQLFDILHHFDFSDPVSRNIWKIH